MKHEYSSDAASDTSESVKRVHRESSGSVSASSHSLTNDKVSRGSGVQVGGSGVEVGNGVVGWVYNRESSGSVSVSSYSLTNDKVSRG